MKAVIIGFGKIAAKHLEVLKALDIDVVASANRGIYGNSLARKHGILKTYTDYLKMVEFEKPDYIINCVSFDHIYETTKNLIPYKIPMLIEKPAGTTVEELNDLIGLQKTYDTRIQVALNRRHYSIFNNAINDAGGIYNITSIHVEWSETPLRLLNEKGYTPKQVGQMLYGNSIHGIDMLTYFSQGLEDYKTHTISKTGKFRWLMNLNGRSNTGMLVSFQSSWDNPVPWRMVMTSQGKRYNFAPLETCNVIEDGVKRQREIEADWYDTNFKAGFYNQMRYFIEDKGEEHSLIAAKQSMKVAEEFYKILNG